MNLASNRDGDSATQAARPSTVHRSFGAEVDAANGFETQPSIGLRARGKSWDQIIEGAQRTGGSDLGCCPPTPD